MIKPTLRSSIFRHAPALLVCAGLLLNPHSGRADEESEKDAAFLEAAKTLDIQSLEGSIIACERLHKVEMAQALARILAERSPDNKVASELLTKAGTKAATEAPEGANGPESPADSQEDAFDAALEGKRFADAESLARKLMADSPDAASGAEKLARVMLAQNQSAAAAELLLAHRSEKYAGKPYPNALLLGEALADSGRKTEATAVMSEIISQAGGYAPEAVAEARNSLRQWQKEEALVSAESALERKDLPAARQALAALESVAPQAAEIPTLTGRVLAMEGKHEDAVRAFQSAKQRSPEGAAYAGQLELAHALLYTGRYSEAGRALDEILDTPAYDASVKEQAGEKKREWQVDHGAGMQADLTGVTADEGESYTLQAMVQTAWRDAWRWKVWTRTDSLSLDEENRVLAETDRTAVEGGMTVFRALGGLTASASLGGAEDHLLAGASLGQSSDGPFRWNIEGAYNELVQNSFQLQAINARQHRIGASVECALGSAFHFEAAGHLREVEIDGTSFGSGGGLEYALLATILGTDEHHRGPELRAGYIGNVQNFNGKMSETLRRLARTGEDPDELPAMLMERRINQHGLVLGIEGGFSESVRWNLGGAVVYDFFDERFEVTGRIGLEAWLSASARVNASFEYLSSGQGPNSGGSVTAGRLGMVLLF